MKKENRKELERIIRTGGLLAVFLVVLGVGRYFVSFDIQFEKLIIPLALFFCFFVLKLLLTLKSEDSQTRTAQARWSRTLITYLFVLLFCLGGVLWILWRVGYFG